MYGLVAGRRHAGPVAPARRRIGATGKSTGKATARGRHTPMLSGFAEDRSEMHEPRTCRMNLGRARLGDV